MPVQIFTHGILRLFLVACVSSCSSVMRITLHARERMRTHTLLNPCSCSRVCIHASIAACPTISDCNISTPIYVTNVCHYMPATGTSVQLLLLACVRPPRVMGKLKVVSIVSGSSPSTASGCRPQEFASIAPFARCAYGSCSMQKPTKQSPDDVLGHWPGMARENQKNHPC
jgi:hypothetical protein